ncbi:MAG: ATP-binding cassette domain-containing protein [Myxococcota bacterium]
MIEVTSLRKVFPGPTPREPEIVAVDDVSFQVPAGQTLCLIGTSGSGKTTTMKMINRLIEPSGGTIRIGGEDVMAQDPIQLRRRIGYVIQKGGLFPHMTVGRNVTMPCELVGWDADRRRRRADTLLAMVNLDPDEFRDRHPRSLSGGQRQRVGVARALAMEPDYILMDEPFGALDPITRGKLHREFQALTKRLNKTIILVTHDMAEAFALGDQVALMHGGALVQIGTEEDFRQRPADDFVVRFLDLQEGGP